MKAEEGVGVGDCCRRGGNRERSLTRQSVLGSLAKTGKKSDFLFGFLLFVLVLFWVILGY